jgi:hypothetical protein
MTPDLTFGILFIFLLLYSLIRPFQSIFSKMFLIFGSCLGLLSVINIEVVDDISRSFGVERGADLYLYLGLITSFLFFLFLLNRFSSLENKINTLARHIALKDLEEKNADRKEN